MKYPDDDQRKRVSNNITNSKLHDGAEDVLWSVRWRRVEVLKATCAH